MFSPACRIRSSWCGSVGDWSQAIRAKSRGEISGGSAKVCALAVNSAPASNRLKMAFRMTFINTPQRNRTYEIKACIIPTQTISSVAQVFTACDSSAQKAAGPEYPRGKRRAGGHHGMDQND